jgi:peroxiredoxin
VPVTVTDKDSFANSTVKGGPMNVELQKIEAGEKKYDAQLTPLYDKYAIARKAKDKAQMDDLEKQMDIIDSTKTEDVYGNYLKAHPTSPIAIFVLQDYAGYAVDADKIEPLYNKLPENEKGYSAGKTLKGQIDIAKLTGIGKPALEFTQNDTLDKPVSLSNFKGKYVLLDFWASWCGPCRAENPNVVAAYNKYKGKGFSILSVSLDQPGAKEKWMKAIHDDNLTWTHVSDLKFWDNAVAKEYGIQAIPQNFLIDPDGKIVGKDLRGDALEQKLATIFP